MEKLHKLVQLVESGNIEELKKYSPTNEELFGQYYNSHDGGKYPLLHIVIPSTFPDYEEDFQSGVIQKKLQIMEYLLDSGTPVNITDEYKNTALKKAAHMGFVNFVKILLSYDADVNVKNKFGNTPLSEACTFLNEGSVEVVEMLLKNGADPNLEAPVYATVGSRFIQRDFDRRRTIVKLLADHGAELKYALEYLLVNTRVSKEHDAEPEAINVMTLLLESGLPVNPRPGSKDFGPLHYAVKNNLINAARILLEHGADAGAVNGKMLTPLYLAVQVDSVKMADLLIFHGADISVGNGKKNDTALHLAAAKGKRNILPFLLFNGADESRTNADKKTPKELAVQKKKIIQYQNALKDVEKSKEADPYFSIREKLENLVKELESNDKTEIRKLEWGIPGQGVKFLEELKKKYFTLPLGLSEYLSEVNGFELEWRTKEKSGANNDYSYGYAKLLGSDDNFTKLNGGYCFDNLQPELNIGYLWISREAPLYFCQDTGRPEPIHCKLPEYIDLLVASRGYEHWAITILPAEQDLATTGEFMEYMPLIFKDFDKKLFVNKLKSNSKKFK